MFKKLFKIKKVPHDLMSVITFPTIRLITTADQDISLFTTPCKDGMTEYPVGDDGDHYN